MHYGRCGSPNSTNDSSRCAGVAVAALCAAAWPVCVRLHPHQVHALRTLCRAAGTAVAHLVTSVAFASANLRHFDSLTGPLARRQDPWLSCVAPDFLPLSSLSWAHLSPAYHAALLVCDGFSEFGFSLLFPHPFEMAGSFPRDRDRLSNALTKSLDFFLSARSNSAASESIQSPFQPARTFTVLCSHEPFRWVGATGNIETLALLLEAFEKISEDRDFADYLQAAARQASLCSQLHILNALFKLSIKYDHFVLPVDEMMVEASEKGAVSTDPSRP
ncbi:hypothetical protein HK405_004057 [Cladochytrium tenue]|nr:hypothetical protein HK405_004057 [Cladochytrium tenue]